MHVCVLCCEEGNNDAKPGQWKEAVMVVGQSSKLSTCRDEAGKGEKKGEGDGISF